MKKILYALFIGVLSVSLLVGCDSQQVSTDTYNNSAPAVTEDASEYNHPFDGDVEQEQENVEYSYIEEDDSSDEGLNPGVQASLITNSAMATIIATTMM